MKSMGLTQCVVQCVASCLQGCAVLYAWRAHGVLRGELLRLRLGAWTKAQLVFCRWP